MSRVQRFPTWLYAGLRLKEQKIPIELDDEVIQGTVDIVSGGRAYSTYTPIEVTQPENTAAQTRVLVSENEDFHQLVWYMSFLNSRAAADTVIFDLQDSAGGGRTIRWLQQLVGGGQVQSSFGFRLDGQRPMHVPPRWRFQAFFAITGPAESQVATLLVENVPVGFNPF